MVLEYLATKLGHLFFLNVGDSYSIHGAYGYTYMDAYLVGGLEHVLFSHVLGIVIPIDALIFFRGVFPQPPTTNQTWAMSICHFWPAKDLELYLQQGRRTMRSPATPCRRDLPGKPRPSFVV